MIINYFLVVRTLSDLNVSVLIFLMNISLFIQITSHYLIFKKAIECKTYTLKLENKKNLKDLNKCKDIHVHGLEIIPWRW